MARGSTTRPARGLYNRRGLHPAPPGAKVASHIRTEVNSMPNMQCDALQLYTVRDMAAKDFAGTMKKVADVGYKRVELAGYGNLKDAKSARKALDDAGLKAISGHFAIDLLENKPEQV